jgi:hypothetical protein
VQAIVQSVLEKAGEAFIIKFSRQSGKDEALVHVLIHLLTVLYKRDASMVMACPTFKPQIQNAMERLAARLEHNVIAAGLKWHRHGGYIFKMGSARVMYFSAEPSANVVGATASHLLVINEAQDVSPGIYDKRFAPMAAAHNATRVFAGTAWTSDTLLEREERNARKQEDLDGKQRVFIVDAEEVGRNNPAYAEFVSKEVARMGREHPLIKSQYFCETVDSETGMFPEGLLVSISAPHPDPLPEGARGTTVFLIDVGGQAEASADPEAFAGGGRDAAALSIVHIDTSTIPLLQGPTYHVIRRESWTGANHLRVFAQVKALAAEYLPRHIVIDASGVGEGLWALLDNAFPGSVIPVKFSVSKKSEIGWRFLSIIGTGRFRDRCHTPEVALQYRYARSEILPGPARHIRWGVPDGTRHQASGMPIHDDHLLADSLVAEIDFMTWSVPTRTLVAEAQDPIEEMDGSF